MIRTLLILLALLCALNQNSFADPAPTKPNKMALTELQSAPSLSIASPESRHRTTLDEPLGEVHVAGTTWYDLQHNGSGGRMIAIDPDGNAHLTWMNGLDSLVRERHVFYNEWYLLAQDFEYEGGFPIDGLYRTGYCNIDLYESGCPFVGLHEFMPPYVPRVRIYPCVYDNMPLCGCDLSVSTCPIVDGAYVTYYWPKFAIIENRVHVILASDDYAEETDIFYCQGEIIDGSDSIVWQPVDGQSAIRHLATPNTISHEIAASRIGNRVAMGWAQCQDLFGQCTRVKNDFMLMRSEDNGTTWSDTRNVTHFNDGDADCLAQTGDTAACNRDTFRLYTDLSLLFDQSDILHAAFTTRSWFTFFRHWGPSTIPGSSMIWHWNEATGQFSLIADGCLPAQEPFYDFGAYQLHIQRPSLSIDETSGNLFCAYMAYDTTTRSYAEDYFSADVFISVSTNGGANWSVGTNVTRTHPVVPAPVPYGMSLSEREPTLAEIVSDGMLHLTYVLDHDAGALPQDEGLATLNEFIYQRIPVDSIPTTPLMPQYPLHWDSSGFFAADERVVQSPREFMLHPVFPNPFNGMANIRFELPRAAQVSVRIFDITGREVETLLGSRLNSGEHQLTWQPQARASGIYFLRITADKFSRSEKVLYLR